MTSWKVLQELKTALLSESSFSHFLAYQVTSNANSGAFSIVKGPIYQCEITFFALVSL